ncbi:MAG: KTSC domain-containing protein [Sedimentisphaerales bacterium]|nr:KTSC domain-containing protein [Sedimentisphaerales bacterium]
MGYDLDSGTLEVEFASGAIYVYFNVPAHVYDGLMRAPSKGMYLNQNIKNRYSYQQVA